MIESNQPSRADRSIIASVAPRRRIARRRFVSHAFERTSPSSSRASLPIAHTVPPRASSIIRVPSNHPTPKIRSRAIRSMDGSMMGTSEWMTRRHRVESVERRTRPWKRCARRREPSSFVRSFVRSIARRYVDTTTDRTVMRMMANGAATGAPARAVFPLIWTLMAFDVSLVWRRARLHTLILYTCEGYICRV